mgnify:CR=1 FL=1
MFIGVDVGGSNMSAGLFDLNRNLVETAKVKSKAKEYTETIIGQLIKVIDKLILNIPSDSQLKAIGIGVAGLIDGKTSTVTVSGNLNINGVNFKEILGKHYDLPVCIENDVNVGVLGEWKHGGGKGHENVVGIFVGTGIGGGLVLNNRLYTGAGGMAGEIGHIVVSKGGVYCTGCGTQGCLEAHAGKVGLEDRIRNISQKHIQSTLIDLVNGNNGKLKSSFIKTALDDGDAVAHELIEEAMDYLAVGIASTINMLNPSVVVLGGGVMEAVGQPYLDRIKRTVQNNSYEPIFRKCEYKLAELGDNSGIFGAMELVVDL